MTAKITTSKIESKRPPLSDVSLGLELEAFAEAQLGPLKAVRFCGWEHAKSHVWRLEAEAGTAYLKRHEQDRKFKQERDAYENWAPRLAPFTPRLLAVDEAKPAALLISAVEAGMVDDLELTAFQERELHRQAGRFLSLLHGLPLEDDDPMSPEDALRVRAAAWCERASGVVDDAVLAWVRAELMVAGRFKGLARVPCHRDFSPRNWLFDPSSERLYVIDFEHARADAPLSDLLKLWDGPWLGRPDLESAFFEGYGRTLSEREEAQLEAMGALHALATVLWSKEHGDEAYEAHGWRLLARLRAKTR